MSGGSGHECDLVCHKDSHSPIGRGKYLPSYIVDNSRITMLDRNDQTGKPYKDNLCFFPWLALHSGYHTKNLERYTKHYYQHYRAEIFSKKFHGVKLSEFDEIKKFDMAVMCSEFTAQWLILLSGLALPTNVLYRIQTNVLSLLWEITSGYWVLKAKHWKVWDLRF